MYVLPWSLDLPNTRFSQALEFLLQRSRTKPKLGQDPGRDLAWEISKEANAEIELGLSSQALD